MYFNYYFPAVAGVPKKYYNFNVKKKLKNTSSLLDY